MHQPPPLPSQFAPRCSCVLCAAVQVRLFAGLGFVIPKDIRDKAKAADEVFKSGTAYPRALTSRSFTPSAHPSSHALSSVLAHLLLLSAPPSPSPSAHPLPQARNEPEADRCLLQ